MPRYLIEVSQPAESIAKRVAESVRTLGSHFATHADWRNIDGIAKGRLVVETDDQRRALAAVPPNMRSSARIFRLEAPVERAAPWLPAPDGAAYATAA